MTEDTTPVMAFKLATVWGAVGITSWSDVAAFLAAVYSAVLIGEWLWKHGGRQWAERQGLVKRRMRRKDD